MPASPGGLVSALEPVMHEADGAWVGWAGAAGDGPGSCDASGMHLVGVGLSAKEVSDYCEGFCNATLWPLYHDVIAPPKFRWPWWDAYVRVNRRFARAAAEQAAIGATVWVNDYQLRLVPKMLREQRSDLRIGVFIHIPFPGYKIFAQLPWRRQIVAGLLGADLLGFQRDADATNFRRACRRAAGLVTSGSLVRVPAEEHVPAGQFTAARLLALAGNGRFRPVGRYGRRHSRSPSVRLAGRLDAGWPSSRTTRRNCADRHRRDCGRTRVGSQYGRTDAGRDSNKDRNRRGRAGQSNIAVRPEHVHPDPRRLPALRRSAGQGDSEAGCCRIVT